MGLLVITKERREPKYGCLACETVFYEGEESAYQRHVVACSEKHHEGLVGESLRVKAPGIYDPDRSGDVELGRWVRLNRGLLFEGRRKL